MGMLLNRHREAREATAPVATVEREEVPRATLHRLRAQAAVTDEAEARVAELEARLAELEEVDDGDGPVPEVIDFEAMTKQGIVDLAKERFEIELDKSDNKATLMDQFRAAQEAAAQGS